MKRSFGIYTASAVGGLALALLLFAVTPTFHPFAISGTRQSGLRMLQWDLPAAVLLFFTGIFLLTLRSGTFKTNRVPFAIAFVTALALGLYLALYKVFV